MRSCPKMNAIKESGLMQGTFWNEQKKGCWKNQEKPLGKGANQKCPQDTAPEWSTKGKWKSKSKYTFVI
jgi:hypothetical protein